MRHRLVFVLVSLVGVTGCHTYDSCVRDPINGGRYRDVTHVGVTETVGGSEYYSPTMTAPARCPNTP